MTRIPAALAACALLLTTAACAARPAAGGPPVAPASHGADQEVIRVSEVGGFVSPDYLLTRLPTIAVYGDGRVITEAVRPTPYPGPAWPDIEVRHITAAGLDRLVDLMVSAGVGGKADYGRPGVTDLPDTVFTVLTAGGSRTSSVYALGYDEGHGLDDAQVKARDRLVKLLGQLRDLPGTLGADAVSAASPYVPAAIVAIARPWSDSGGPRTAAVAWPGPELPGAQVAYGQHCVTVTGAQAGTVYTAAQTASQTTPWTTGARAWQVSFRPLLPAETDCASLTGR